MNLQEGVIYLCKRDPGLEYSASPVKSFIIGSCRIPIEELETVYVHCEPLVGRYSFFAGHNYYYELQFCYENGDRLSVRVHALSHEKDFEQLIRRYDDNVKIYIHQKLKEREPLLCPFQRFKAEEPFVKREVMEELTTLCNGNLLWCLNAKSRYKWNGNQEVELILYGTAWTWLIWLAWLCLSGYLFFNIRSLSAGLLVLSGAGVYYYMFFVRSARKVTEKAKAILSESIRGIVDQHG